METTKRRKLKPLEPIEIEWRDSCAHEPWQSINELNADAESWPTQYTVGYFVKVTDEYLLVTRSRDNEDPPQTEGGFQIPRSCVRHIYRFGTKREIEL